MATDRAQGGASLADGELELMVHRRILHDDGRGVGEPLSEPGVDGKGLIIAGKFKVVISNISSAPEHHKAQTQHLTFPAIPSFTPLSGTVADFLAVSTTQTFFLHFFVQSRFLFVLLYYVLLDMCSLREYETY